MQGVDLDRPAGSRRLHRSQAQDVRNAARADFFDTIKPQSGRDDRVQQVGERHMPGADASANPSRGPGVVGVRAVGITAIDNDSGSRAPVRERTYVAGMNSDVDEPPAGLQNPDCLA